MIAKFDDGHQSELDSHHVVRRQVADTTALCSGQEYNTTLHRCCEGSIVEVPSSLSKSSADDVARYAWCCASSSYDIRTSLCCAGSLRPDVASKADRGHYRCCGSDALDIRKFKCCGSASVTLGDIPAKFAQCCGGSLFNNETKGCCAGMPFNTKTHLCCEGSLTAEGGTDTHLCCGPTSFARSEIKSRNLVCCDGQVTEAVQGAKCCGAVFYDPQSDEGCCNGELYDKTIDICCQGKDLRTGHPETEFECCAYGLLAKSSDRMCCDRTIVQGRPELGHACCGRDSYKMDAQVCCGAPGKEKVYFGRKCAEANLTKKQLP